MDKIDDNITYDIKEPGLNEVTDLYRQLWMSSVQDINTRLENAYHHMAERSKLIVEYHNKMQEVIDILNEYQDHTKLVRELRKFSKERKFW